MHQLFDGLRYLHDVAKIAHRDLKTSNVFICHHLRVKIGDLGIATIMNESFAMKTMVGTPYYMSPEIVAQKEYGPKTDVWSMGCILYECLSGGETPWSSSGVTSIDSLFKVILNSPVDVSRLPKYEKLVGLDKWCLAKDPADRPSAAQALELFQMQDPPQAAIHHFAASFIQEKFKASLSLRRFEKPSSAPPNMDRPAPVQVPNPDDTFIIDVTEPPPELKPVVHKYKPAPSKVEIVRVAPDLLPPAGVPSKKIGPRRLPEMKPKPHHVAPHKEPTGNTDHDQVPTDTMNLANAIHLALGGGKKNGLNDDTSSVASARRKVDHDRLSRLAKPLVRNMPKDVQESYRKGNPVFARRAMPAPTPWRCR